MQVNLQGHVQEFLQRPGLSGEMVVLKGRTAISVCLMLFLACTVAVAHPHAFASSAVDVVFDEKGVAGFRVRWLFDEMFSSMILMDFDQDGDRKLNAAEIEGLKKGAFDNLRKFSWFTHIRVDGKPFAVKFVTDFSARVHKDKLIYQFFVPCHVAGRATPRNIAFSLYDKEYYCAILYIKNPVAYENDAGFAVEHRLETNRSAAYYYDMVYPEEILLRFKRENG